MGSGNWSADSYSSAKAMRAATGTPTFAHTAAMRSAPPSARKVHELLDPKQVAGPDSPFAGQIMRESRDSDEHPNSLPIVVCFDETGSMGTIPQVLQTKLPDLFGLLLRKGYVEDPQILMAAVGDGTYGNEVAPWQIGQFESDNRIDATLEAIYLEGLGGGGNHESYADIAWFLANKTATDAWDKRQKKGYVFFIGDERLYRKVRADAIQRMIGENPEADIDTTEIFAALKERFNVYFLFCSQASYQASDVLNDSPRNSSEGALGWRTVLGENALILDDTDAVCETIALTIGIGEGTIDLDTGLEDLAEIGSTSGHAVGKALAKVAAGSGGGSVVVADGPGDLDVSGGSGVSRL